MAVELLFALLLAPLAAHGSPPSSEEPLAVLVVRNPLPFAREDVVEAWVPPTQLPEILVAGPDGKTARAQRIGDDLAQPPGMKPGFKIAFLANLPANGVASYRVDHAVWFNQAHPAKASPGFGPPNAGQTFASANGRTLENDRLKVALDEAGDLSSIYDKARRREALGSPIHLDLWRENRLGDPPTSRVAWPAAFKVVERGGAVIAAVEVAREANGMRFVQTVRLAAGGAGDRVEVENRTEWDTRQVALKAVLRVSTPSRKAVCASDVGTGKKGDDDIRGHDAPFHRWIDLVSADGRYGVGVLNPGGMPSDQPSNDTLRLSLAYTPPLGGVPDRRVERLSVYDIAPHAGDWRKGKLPEISDRIARPIQVFTAPPSTAGERVD